MTEEALIEKIAEIIYRHQGGIRPDEYTEITGERQRMWSTGMPWDSQPDVELCEHERDEYRTQARAVIDFLNNKVFELSL